MTSTMPVPFIFELPNEHWRPVEPESLGVHNAAFLAVRDEHTGDYTPTLSISGDWRPDDATLDQIADEAVVLLGRQGTEVELVRRRDAGSEQAPAVFQVLGATAVAEGQTWDIRQGQVFLALKDVTDPRERAVVAITLTTTFGQFDEYLPELQTFMRSVEVRNRDEGPTDEGPTDGGPSPR